MLSLNDIINASFRKSGFSGYRTEDVDKFIDDVKDSYDELIKKNISQKEEYETLKAENNQLTEKLKILASKIEEYRSEEDEIKNALVSAQKLGDASIRESRHKAEIIIKDANLKADRIIAAANAEIAEQKRELDRLQKTVSDFRSRLLSAYKEHLTLIDALPAQKPEEKPVEAPQEELSQPEQPAEEPRFIVPQEPETAEDGSDDPVFSAEVSGFDEPAQPASGRFGTAQFGSIYGVSDDSDSPDGILR
jgi:cell division initiation protein